MDYWNGLLEGTTGMNYWNELLEWTTGLTFFVLKMSCTAATCNIYIGDSNMASCLSCYIVSFLTM